MKRIVSGMRPTGKLHLGNYEGALKNWVKLQHQYECFFFIADWHALTSDYADTSRIKENTLALHTEILVLTGTDGRKMSKSYNNTIELADAPETIREKVRRMITDRTRIKRSDPGHPEACDVCQMHRLFVPAAVADQFDDDCRNARIGCVDRKRALADAL